MNIRTFLFGVAGVVAIVTIVATTISTAPRLRAQTPASVPSFEVASVKPNKTGSRAMTMSAPPGGQYTVTNMPLRSLILQAYGLQNVQLVGGPDWITSDRFDIVAKAEGNAAPQQFQLTMRALLADRFKLTVHNETRELPIYALVLARSDGKLGPQLRPSTLDCTNASGARGLRVSPSATILGGPPTCRMTMAVGRLIAGGMTIAQLVSTLSGLAGRTVMDRTGLTGTFDVDLAWIPEPGEGLWLGEQRLSPRDVAPGAAPPPPSDGASIFTALQEQLGLKLDSSKAPMEVLVIDHVEQPTED